MVLLVVDRIVIATWNDNKSRHSNYFKIVIEVGTQFCMNDRKYP